MNLDDEIKFYAKQAVRTYRRPAQVAELQRWMERAFARFCSAVAFHHALFLLTLDGVVRQEADGSFIWLGEFAGR